ncbi:hypothetical protein Y032_0087g2082 [Ancylostoma ceylanicum]|uniref:Secreted protein n=1 Tax=Ancylostoma ceylanicum TaxID=53326 RepID=A0A016TQ72_9BILA|nr:hypothetical protein Y032_0087g2082 [Ancylostoma ceylanicum]
MRTLLVCCLAAFQFVYAVTTDRTTLSELSLVSPRPGSSQMGVTNKLALSSKWQSEDSSKTMKEVFVMSSLRRVKRQWGGHALSYNYQQRRRCRRSIREKRMGFPMFGGGPMFGAPPFFGGGGCCCCCCCSYG